MRRLLAFNHVSVDGYFVDGRGDMSWARANSDDTEWNAFVAANAVGQGPLLFGRVTYDLMAGYWPTPMARHHGSVAESMNSRPKVVFSRTLKEASWANTRLMSGDLCEEVRRMKLEEGEGMTIFGSGIVIAQLAGEGLIDEYQFVLNPIVLGAGRTTFEGVSKRLAMKQTGCRAFTNGNVLLTYVPGD